MRWLKNILPVLGIIFLVYVIKKVGIAQIVDSLLKANYLLILLAGLLLVPLTLLQTAKWDYILKKQKIRLDFAYLLKVQIVSIFYESITPAKVGSFIKIAYLQDRLKNFGKAASSVVIDRFLDFLVVAFFAFIGSLIFLKNKENIVYAPVIVFALFLLGFIFLTNKKLSRIAWNIAYGVLIPKSLKERANNSFNEFYKVLPKLKEIFVLSMLTVVFWLLVYTQAYIFALAFNVKIIYIKFIFLFAISVIIGLIPITISGFGTREATLLTIFSNFGAAEGGIVTFSLAWATLGVLIYAIAALVILFRKKI